MKMMLKASLTLVLFFCSSSLMFGQKVTFELIPGAASANDLTPDGRYVVGNLDSDNNGAAYRYDCVTKTMTILPTLPPPADRPANVVAISDDGTVVLGNIDEDGSGGLGPTAGIWRESTNQWESLGFLPNALNCPSRSSAYELSADGTIATGLSWDGCNGRGFVWTEKTGMLELQSLANGNNRSSVMSADGSFFAGFAQGSFSRTPTFWQADLSGELLDPPNGDVVGEVHGISDDGSIMLGEWSGDATKWTLDGSNWVRETIGSGSVANSYTGIPTDIANDGTIVGFEINFGFRRSFILYQGKGDLVLLRNWAIANGAVIPDQLGLQVCQAISTDGTKMIGHDFLDLMTQFAWIIQVESDVLLGDVNLDGNVNLLDVDPFVNVLTTGDFQEEADINQDGEVNLLDVDPFVALLSG